MLTVTHWFWRISIFGSIYMVGPLQLSYQCDLFFTKLQAISLNKCQKWKKHVENIKMAKFEGPVKRDWDFIMVWRFVWKKLLERKALLSSNIFHTNPLNPFENSNSHINFKYSLIPGASNLATLLFLICSF